MGIPGSVHRFKRSLARNREHFAVLVLAVMALAVYAAFDVYDMQKGREQEQQIANLQQRVNHLEAELITAAVMQYQMERSADNAEAAKLAAFYVGKMAAELHQTTSEAWNEADRLYGFSDRKAGK